MDDRHAVVIERLTAHIAQVDALRAWLQLIAARIRTLPGVQQLELIQNHENPTEFIFFLVVADLPTLSELLDQADWHTQFVQELPRLMSGDLERIVGHKIA